MIYKIVPAPKLVSIQGGKLNQCTDLFEEKINSMARDGWTYVSMETITVREKQGCINPQSVDSTLYMLIFSKEN